MNDLRMKNYDLMIDDECAVDLPSGPGVRKMNDLRMTI